VYLSPVCILVNDLYLASQTTKGVADDGFHFYALPPFIDGKAQRYAGDYYAYDPDRYAYPIRHLI